MGPGTAAHRNRTRQRDSSPPVAADGQALFSIHPNPTSVAVVISYDLPQGMEQARIVVRDLSGRAVWSAMLPGAQGQRIWDTGQLAPGTYTVQYLSGAELLHTERLVVQR